LGTWINLALYTHKEHTYSSNSLSLFRQGKGKREERRGKREERRDKREERRGKKESLSKGKERKRIALTQVLKQFPFALSLSNWERGRVTHKLKKLIFFNSATCI